MPPDLIADMMNSVRSKKEQASSKKHSPLTQAESDRLAKFLAAYAEGPAMSMEEVDGFFCALIAGPQFVAPSEFLPEVFGTDVDEVASSSSLEELNAILGLLLKHWNSIIDSLLADQLHPIFLSAKKEGRGNEWARGFLAGAEMRHEAWADQLEGPPTYLYAVKWFAYENDPALRPAPLPGKTRDDILAMLEVAPLEFYRHYAPQREEEALKASEQSTQPDSANATDQKSSDFHGPLSESEMDRIDELLLSIESGEAMNFEELDGFFCALVVHPQNVSPAEYMPLIFGGEMTEVCRFNRPQEAEEISKLLARHWNSIEPALADNTYSPVMADWAGGIPLGNDWAFGFLKGISIRGTDWMKGANAEEEDMLAGFLLPMLVLAHENDPDETLRPPPIRGRKKREDLIETMAFSAIRFYRYFRPEIYPREQDFFPDLVRTAPKTGRNEPCPCGSGKKYKRCCGA